MYWKLLRVTVSQEKIKIKLSAADCQTGMQYLRIGSTKAKKDLDTEASLPSDLKHLRRRPVLWATVRMCFSKVNLLSKQTPISLIVEDTKISCPQILNAGCIGYVVLDILTMIDWVFLGLSFIPQSRHQDSIRRRSSLRESATELR